jgi:FkbM family methyltransferase
MTIAEMKLIKKQVRQLCPGLYEKLAYYKMRLQMKRFSKKYPQCRLFFGIFENETRRLYSQYNQDYLVHENFFKGVTDGFYCDVGGNHPLNINNTRYFEELGWSGCAFEPLPHMQKLWKEHRKARFFPFAASDREGEVEFSMVDDVSGWEDMLSFVKETSPSGYDYNTKEILVRTRPLKDVFQEEGIRNIDYLSIDVEGHEMKVLQGIDFDEVDVKVLTIENNFGGIGNASHYGDDGIRDLMLANGFVLWGRIISLDDIYVSTEFHKSLEQ